MGELRVYLFKLLGLKKEFILTLISQSVSRQASCAEMYAAVIKLFFLHSFWLLTGGVEESTRGKKGGPEGEKHLGSRLLNRRIFRLSGAEKAQAKVQLVQ